MKQFLNVLAVLYFVIVIFITLITPTRGDSFHDGNNVGHVSLNFWEGKKYYINNFESLNSPQKMFIIEEIFGNLLLFVPFTTALFFLKRVKFSLLKNISLLIGAVLFIETTQYILKVGVFDVDDIFLNTLGGLVGLFVFEGLHKKIYK